MDYGDYSRDLYSVFHGTVGIHIPNKIYELKIPLNNIPEAKL